MIQLIIYSAYCLIISAVNILFHKHKQTNKEIYEIIGGILFLTIMAGSTAMSFYLSLNKILFIPMWPENAFLSLGLLIILYIFARTEMITSVFSEKREFTSSISTFFGAIGIHFSSMLATIGILYPMLKSEFSLPIAFVLTALSFPVYHYCQFFFFPKGITFKFQFQLFSFSLGYVLFYEISGSFILTFVLQHFIASTTFIYNKDYDFGKRDLPFYFGIIFVTIAIASAFIYMK